MSASAILVGKARRRPSVTNLGGFRRLAPSAGNPGGVFTAQNPLPTIRNAKSHF